jgi:CHAD domain-containing protein
VLGLLGTATAGPVATIATTRAVTPLLDGDGRVLAEVADDRVVGTVLPTAVGEPAGSTSWRELEVELVEGNQEVLDAVVAELVAAGATLSQSASKLGQVLADRLAALDGAPRRGTADVVPAGKPAKKKRAKQLARLAGTTAGDVVLAAVAVQLAALRAADLAVRTDQPEGIHDLRVACRRLRSIFAAFRPVLAREATEPIREELRWVGAELSAARDGEVALEHLRALVAEQPGELVLGPVAARLQQAEIRDHADGGRRAGKALSDRRYLRLLDTLDRLLAEPPLTDAAQRPAGPAMAEAVQRSGKRFRRAVRTAHRATGDAQHLALHDVRKAAKRVRYTAEVAVPVLGAPAEALVGCLKEVQDTLGEAQDTVVTRAWCTRLGLAAQAAGENAWTYGRLHMLEEVRAERAEAAFWAMEPAVRRTLEAASKHS